MENQARLETKEELEQKIYKEIKKIRRMYYKAYPNGNYMSIAFFEDSILFNNGNEDKEDFPIDFWRRG